MKRHLKGCRNLQKHMNQDDSVCEQKDSTPKESLMDENIVFPVKRNYMQMCEDYTLVKDKPLTEV